MSPQSLTDQGNLPRRGHRVKGGGCSSGDGGDGG